MIFPHTYIITCMVYCTSLTNNNVASNNMLTTKKFSHLIVYFAILFRFLNYQLLFYVPLYYSFIKDYSALAAVFLVVVFLAAGFLATVLLSVLGSDFFAGAFLAAAFSSIFKISSFVKYCL